ncbi:GNAT family N-acetyltransferase [Candidatus Odyssella acanthamoebae]|uniref:Acetyltransferase n=1 Tax=Candidatus Odyssella acanthamoebae TaxID=91604 RepID=A0A077AWZ7_9PROT|nr:GNAT family N-acetyltransferase [Candidatus Paracaedibacter acanthamoebae]AIK97086.1 acetyltransferase [Candidatus Paracaedibacter acanthamoebae]
MVNISLRPATITDIPDLLPLIDQLGYPTTEEELATRFSEFVALEGYGVVVACHQNRVIGFIAWSLSRVFVASKLRYHIEALIIDEAYRGQGIGKHLMTHFEALVVSCGKPVLIDLTSGYRRAAEGTHDFYKALGYKNEGPMAKLYLRKEIS